MIRDLNNRTDLKKEIPLNSPLVCHIEVTNLCNFKCKFCPSVDNSVFDEQKKGFMSFDLFKKIIDDLSAFEKPLKLINFHLWGEPLLNPKIVKMVEYAKSKRVSQKLMIYTNGSLLTPALSRQLVDAGLDCIQISVEHVNAEGYEKITNAKTDYDKLLANVGYLCAYKKESCEVIAKILDCGLTEDEKEKFFNDFNGIVDECHIESLIKVLPDDIRDTTLGFGAKTTNDGYERKEKKVCTLPFYILGIAFDGTVAPCVCDYSKGLSIGDVNKESLLEIWNGEKRRNLMKIQLMKNRDKLEVCGKCPAVFNQLDDIDDCCEQIITRIQ